MRPRVRRARGELRAARRLERVPPPGRHGVGARGDRGREALPKTSARERVGGAFPGEDVRAAARPELGARLLRRGEEPGLLGLGARPRRERRRERALGAPLLGRAQR